MSKTYRLSPFGIAIHPWLNKPDTKFNKDGVYKLDLRLDGPEATALKEQVEAAANAAYEAYFEDDSERGGKSIPVKDRKNWKVYLPFEVDEDDQGNPTGYIVFTFKQNAKIKLKDGTVKDIIVPIKDASGKKAVHKPVFGGSELRVMFTFRDIPMKSLKQVGVQLALAQVQVKNLKTSGQGGPDFDQVEGYEEEDDGEVAVGTNTSTANPNNAAAADGDY